MLVTIFKVILRGYYYKVDLHLNNTMYIYTVQMISTCYILNDLKYRHNSVQSYYIFQNSQKSKYLELGGIKVHSAQTQTIVNIVTYKLPPVSLSSTRTSMSSKRHGTVGLSPITVRETLNSCFTSKVTRPFLICKQNFNFRCF